MDERAYDVVVVGSGCADSADAVVLGANIDVALGRRVDRLPAVSDRAFRVAVPDDEVGAGVGIQ